MYGAKPVVHLAIDVYSIFVIILKLFVVYLAFFVVSLANPYTSSVFKLD